MTDTKEPLAGPPSAGDVERLKRFFADAFGAGVLHELPLRLDVLRRRRAPRDRDGIRVSRRVAAIRA